MNCKQGDLAVVVRSLCPENVGKVVRCLRFMPAESRSETGIFVAEDGWETDIQLAQMFVDGPLEGQAAPPARYAADQLLRPLRDNEGDDETLAWAGKPRMIVRLTCTLNFGKGPK